jgi:hypothetical protein
MKPAQELWQDYLFLTREMDKFLSRDDVDMFLQLLEEREKMQHILEASDGGEFKKSPEAAKLFTELRQLNAGIGLRLARLRNDAKNQQKVSAAYDIMRPAPVGGRMDHKG